MRKTLKEVLDIFQGVNGDEIQLLKEIQVLNTLFFFGGYFQVNNRKIYLADIEFYYHEEGIRNKMKDFIMYHTNDHEKKIVDYFPLGSFNAHVSGVDFTFENRDKQYRASILIRGIKIVDDNGKVTFESRPTYVYEYLLMGKSLFDSGINIKWVDAELPIKLEQIKQTYRKNVCQYDEEGNRIEYQDGVNQLPVRIGRKVYCQCMRKWRFYLDKQDDNR